ncbi:DUF3558 domain-containing protein [Allokutzneria sp. A3M-2-11 16]|uniref:DUF3558 family protein n=1 Tax=Allokutzneria sp. A3M-2-11 16 TaxID=2962043 RepID=UPI0020B7268B|nr:DUF3558 family protein [Allokutzneria sp. A3M-2-11 16]MCP3798971.1 DUF3558 domain-containing protein [Allokutzneria sp. A3M-2-11 16]
MHTTSRRAAAVAAALVTTFLTGCASTVVGTAEPGPTPPKTTTRSATAKDATAETARVVTSEAGAALMARLRAADLCQALDPEPMKKFGEPVTTFMGPGLPGCKIRAGNSGTEVPTHRFEISPSVYTEIDRQKDQEVEVAGHKVYLPKKAGSEGSCYVRLPIEDTGYAFTISGYKSKGTWPEACEEAKTYAGAIARKLLTIPARTTPPTGKSLLGKDPCAAQQQFLGEFSGWSPGSVSRYNPYGCQIALTKPGDEYSYTLGVIYQYNVEQEVTADTPAVTVAGLSGIRLNKPFMDLPESCAVSLNYKPSDPKGTITGHLISVELSPKQLNPRLGQKAPPQSLKPCDVVDKVATMVVQSAG